MKHILLVGTASLLISLGVTASARAEVIVSFEKMYGVDGPFVNHRQIRSVLGDELPWDVASATGSLETDGHLRISVRGLVFANDPSVPARLRGTNDEASFRALVSCMTEATKGRSRVVMVNRVTAAFPATPSGDSDIDTVVTLPKSCVAPIIFVLSGSELKWFSVTGAEGE